MQRGVEFEHVCYGGSREGCKVPACATDIDHEDSECDFPNTTTISRSHKKRHRQIDLLLGQISRGVEEHHEKRFEHQERYACF